MRDMLFKNMTSLDHHKRDVILSEAFTNNGVEVKTQKHFTYSIDDYVSLSSPQQLETWLKKYAGQGPRLRDLSVLKSYDSKAGEEKFEVQITGNIYVLREQDIFNVNFTQIFKVDRKGETLKA